MMQYQARATPLAADYLCRRKRPLHIEGYQGSIDSPHECLRNTDVVVCVEIIEHLFPETELNLPHNIFGHMKPKIIVFTTPNSDFNVLFGASPFPNGFRHDDHKFEWSREQFRDWAFNLCSRYPNYRVNIAGIGDPPEGQESLGGCSQMACFVRRDILHDQLMMTVDTENAAVTAFPVEKFEYKLLFQTDFPVNEDHRTEEEIIMCGVEYFFNRFIYKYDDEFYYIYERDRYEFPLKDVFECVYDAPDYQQLKDVVKTKYTIEGENDVVIVPAPVDDESNSHDEDDDDDYDDYEVAESERDGNAEEEWA